MAKRGESTRVLIPNFIQMSLYLYAEIFHLRLVQCSHFYPKLYFFVSIHIFYLSTATIINVTSLYYRATPKTYLNGIYILV